MDNISKWLKTFKIAWINKDIEAVLWLFADQIEYWENPYEKFITKEKIKNLWIVINEQKNIKLDLKLFAKEKDKHTIIFDLSYQNKNNENKIFKWVYLIILNSDNKCVYFMQIWE